MHDSIFRKTVSGWFAVILPLAALLCFTGWWFDKNITDEGRILQNAKAVFLLIAVALHVYHSRTLVLRQPMDTWVRIALAFLCIGFFLREVDIDRIGDPAIWSNIELVLRLIAGSGLLIWYGYLLTKFSLFWQLKWQLFMQPVVLLSFIGCVFYLCSWPFDKKIFTPNGDINELFEIIFEMWATLTLCFAAWYPRVIKIND